MKVWKFLYYSFPVQLFILHIRKNQVLLVLWVLLFAIIFQGFGKVLGIPFLFLDAEYLGRVNFWSYLLIGTALGIFTMAYHMTAYILDSGQFPFLCLTRRPFLNFCVNNGLIPITFLSLLSIQIYRFQNAYEHNTPFTIFGLISGLWIGFALISALILLYFNLTNKNSLFHFAENVDRKLRKIRVSRVNMARRLRSVKQKRAPIYWYLSTRFVPTSVKINSKYYNKNAVLRVFDQHHLNSVMLQGGVLLLIFILGYFRNYPALQLPAAASSLLLFTLILMILGMLTFWLRSWAFSTAVALLFIVNFFSGYSSNPYMHAAIGLDYHAPLQAYNPAVIDSLASDEIISKDRANTLNILNKWRNQYPANEPPLMVMICTSGGGQRSALWTLRSLQTADSLTNGKLMQNTRLITGASGGMIGAAYYRELFLQKQLGKPLNIWQNQYLHNISKDNLNPIIFSLVVHDIFPTLDKYSWAGQEYKADRGLAFEEQLNRNTEGLLNKSLGDYRIAEQEALIPMMILAPNITNDGRKLYIGSQGLSYMVRQDKFDAIGDEEDKVVGVDFQALFRNHQADSLRFLSALRMNATFPYITPNQVLPTNPPVETMDSGIADNFGLEDALRFAYAYRDWIEQETKGVLLLCVRDSERNKPAEELDNQQVIDKLINPLENIYRNWTNIQDSKNDNLIRYAKSWLNVPLTRIELQYIPRTLKKSDGETAKDIERASLNWRLTNREKENILSNINLTENQEALAKLQQLLLEKKEIEPLYTHNGAGIPISNSTQ